MVLRKQLLLISLVVLILPLGGWQFARQIEQTLRDGHARGLLDSARSMAPLVASTVAETWPDLATQEAPALVYVHQAERAPNLDGYADEWTDWLAQARELQSDDGALRVRVAAARHASGLFLLVHAISPDQIYSRPGGGRGDHVRLSFSRPGQRADVTLAPLAPGWIEARGNVAEGWPRVQGYWQPRGDGWTLELQIPDAGQPTRLGFEVHDVVPGAAPNRTVGREAGLLVGTRSEIDSQLARSTPPGSRAWAALEAGWVVGRAQVDEPVELGREAGAAQPTWLDTLLFERLLSGRLPEGQWRDARTARLSGPELGPTATTQWTTRADDPGIMLSVSAPLVVAGRTVGSVVLSRNADALLIQSNRAALRLVGISLAGMLLMTVVLLGFATLLSERIRRLRDSAENAVGEDGRVQHALPAPRSGDEIGDLGRSISGLLQRLQSHQSYLRTLADKLAHELRTPLAMVQSSLDNIEQAQTPEEVARYCRRANEGSARLNRIFQAMSQAARIEESLGAELRSTFDLVELLERYVPACSETYPERRFRLRRRAAQGYLNGSPDLFAQLLDKLIDNAVDFSPDKGEIEIRVTRKRDRILLEIDNEGPALPEAVAEHLFDSMVSVRQRKSGQVHLGLGLYIARLITEHHQGRISAVNSRRGCCIRMEFAATSARS